WDLSVIGAHAPRSSKGAPYGATSGLDTTPSRRRGGDSWTGRGWSVPRGGSLSGGTMSVPMGASGSGRVGSRRITGSGGVLEVGSGMVVLLEMALGKDIGGKMQMPYQTSCPAGGGGEH